MPTSNRPASVPAAKMRRRNTDYHLAFQDSAGTMAAQNKSTPPFQSCLAPPKNMENAFALFQAKVECLYVKYHIPAEQEAHRAFTPAEMRAARGLDMNDQRHKDGMQHQLASCITFDHFLCPTPVSLMLVNRIPMQRSKSDAQLIPEARRYEQELKAAWEANQKKGRGVNLEVTDTSVMNHTPVVEKSAKMVAVAESTVDSKSSNSAESQAASKQLAPAEVTTEVPETVPTGVTKLISKWENEIVNQAPPVVGKPAKKVAVAKESTKASNRTNSADSHAASKQLAPAEVPTELSETVPPVALPEKPPTNVAPTGRRWQFLLDKFQAEFIQKNEILCTPDTKKRRRRKAKKSSASV